MRQSRGRERGDIDPVSIIDRARQTIGGDYGYSSVEDFVRSKISELEDTEQYTRRAWEDQPQHVEACDYLYEDLAYLESEKNIADRKKIDLLTTILANKLAVFKTKLNREYNVYVSGGGVLVDELYQSFQAKVHDDLKLVKDPVYSNVQGLYKLGKMISASTEGQQEISHLK